MATTNTSGNDINTSAPAQKFLIIDDHPMVRDSMHSLLQMLLPDSKTELAINMAQVRNILRTDQQFDYAIVDLTLPDARGLEVLRNLRELRPAMPLIVYSARVEQDTILRCLNFGIAGYIPKTSYNDVTVQALRMIFAGQVYIPSQAVAEVSRDAYSVPGVRRMAATPRDLSLTERQVDVLDLILRGMSNKVICRKLDLAEGTVKVHVSAVLRALGVSNRTQAVIAAREMGLEVGEF